MQKKTSSLQIVFKNFFCFLGTANLRNKSFLLTGFNCPWCSPKKMFQGNNFSESLEKTVELINDGVTEPAIQRCSYEKVF